MKDVTGHPRFITGTGIQAISSKVLYGEAPPLGSKPYPLIYQFFTQIDPFHNLE